MGDLTFWALLGWFLIAVLASAVGGRNGWKAGTAFLLAIVLGLIGLLIVLVIRVGPPADESVPWLDRT